MTSPYENLPDTAYWRTAVAQRAPLDPGALYTRRFPITPATKIATAGSCFAQHVGRTLRSAGFHILDKEPLDVRVPDPVAQRYGYRLYSARYGNIYTARQLLQLLREAAGEFTPAHSVWELDGRYFDAFRPGVEPEGLLSPHDVARHRSQHLRAVQQMLEELDLFVFTFGLTESWMAISDGTVYPTAPGTIAGRFDPQEFRFHNFTFPEVLGDFEAVRRIVKSHNPGARFLVTVSPVPLTATASGLHVEVATCYSKSVLRAVCGTLSAKYRDVDYFPSYEVITSQGARGAYYEPNLRSVSSKGVDTAMGLFMAAHAPGRNASAQPRAPATDAGAAESAGDEVVCEEALLEAFAR